MTLKIFDARMPHLVAACVPMATVGTVMIPLAHHSGDPWIVYGIAIFFELLAFVLMFAVGFKKYRVSIEDSAITISKTRFIPNEITALQLTKQSLNIMTDTWRKRGLVTFAKKDLPTVTYALNHFSEQHNITLTIK